MEYVGEGYSVSEMTVPANAPCECSGCEWSGVASQLGPIEDCALSAGDPSPAGRCPDCDFLAYVVADPCADFLAYCERREGEFWRRLAGSVRKARTL